MTGGRESGRRDARHQLRDWLKSCALLAVAIFGLVIATATFNWLFGATRPEAQTCPAVKLQTRMTPGVVQ